MVIEVKINKIGYYLNKKGLYVLYCNAKIEGKNSELVQYMLQMDKVYKDVKFLQFSSNDFQVFFNETSKDKMNFIYAYYDRKIQFFEDISEKSKLIIFYEKLTDLYNRYMDDKIKNVGSKLISRTDKKELSKKRQLAFEYHRKSFDNRKIKLILTEFPFVVRQNTHRYSNTSSNIINESKLNKLSDVKNCVEECSMNYNCKNINEIKKNVPNELSKSQISNNMNQQNIIQMSKEINANLPMSNKKIIEEQKCLSYGLKNSSNEGIDKIRLLPFKKRIKKIDMSIDATYDKKLSNNLVMKHKHNNFTNSISSKKDLPVFLKPAHIPNKFNDSKNILSTRADSNRKDQIYNGKNLFNHDTQNFTSKLDEKLINSDSNNFSELSNRH